MPAALLFANQILGLLPMVIQGVTGAIDAMTWGAEAIRKMVDESRDPTQAEWDELNARTQSLRSKLHSDTE